jgi:hypothetical protein
VSGIPEYGTGRHEDYLSQQDERAEQARDQAAGEVTREFAGWFEAQGYPSPDDRYDGEEMAEAFKSGMQAARDLAAPELAALHDQLASAKHALARLTSENPVKAQHEDFFEDEFLARVQYARNALASLPFVSPHEPGAAAS